MSRLILLVLLAVASSMAVAVEWSHVVTSNDGTSIYVDSATILKKGNKAKMWELWDFKTPQTIAFSTDTFLSRVTQSEYDCEEDQFRFHFFKHHSENMGNGNIVFVSNTVSAWTPVVPGTIIESMWKVACGNSPAKTFESEPSVNSQEQQNQDQQREEEFKQQEVRIGNSSIYVPKSLLEGGRLFGKSPEMLVDLRGPISSKDVLVFKKLLAPYLDKNYFKKNPKPSWYRPNPYDAGYSVTLDSEGGDMYAAMKIGRMFRKARIKATVNQYGKCLSSCVLLLAGSVSRYISGSVGIHRPFSTDTEAATFEKIQTKTSRLGAEVSSYLSKMNIPTSLYDNMRSTPSDDIRILTHDELETFGLNQDDPVFAELRDNAEAKLAHLSKSEYLSRKALWNQCVSDGYGRLKQANLVDDPIEFAKMMSECDKKTIYKDVIDQ